MKKFITLFAIVAALFTVNTTAADAQIKYDEINYTLAKTHTMDHIQNGDDFYRMGRYQDAMNEYKSARSYNNYKGTTIVPAREIDDKMDRCADAIRRGNRPEPARRDRNEKASNTAAAVIGGVILGGIIAAAVSSNKSSANNNSSSSYDPSSLKRTSSNGMSYSTVKANNSCRILSVRNEFDYTVVEMEFRDFSKDSRISINKDTFVKDAYSGQKFFLRDVENIGVKATTYVAAGDSHIFRLYFDRINSRCSDIDIIEPGTSYWKFFNVPV